MDLIGTKILVAILFGIVRFLSGVLPIQLYKWLGLCGDPAKYSKDESKPRKEQLMGCCLALFQSFGGGVLFATAFLHMMPEVYYCVEELKRYGTLSSDYPYSQLIVSSGFFLVYFLEEVSNYIISITPQKACKKSKIQPENYNVNMAIGKITTKVKECNEMLQNSFYKKLKRPSINENIKEIATVMPKTPNKDNIDIDKLTENDVAINNFKNGGLKIEEVEKNEVFNNLALEEANETNELGELLEVEEKTQQQILRCILIVIALSLHAIFEGLAIGLQHSVGSIWYLFVSVSVHSATILFCMGLELIKAHIKVKTIIIHIFCLSITSPIGIIIGLVISMSTNTDTAAKSLAVVVLEGLSAGTILYITFFEVLNREKEMRIYRLRRSICIIAGFSLMAILESLKIYEKH